MKDDNRLAQYIIDKEIEVALDEDRIITILRTLTEYMEALKMANILMKSQGIEVAPRSK